MARNIDKKVLENIYAIPFNIDEFGNDKTPIYEYDRHLSELENIKRKNILIQYGRFLTENKKTAEAINYYKYLCNNTYFSNDWYPYRQLTIIYTKTDDYNANLVNIKKLLKSKIYLNNYQYVWFLEKLRQIIEKNHVDEYQIQEWIDYYQSNGALNEKKTNKFLADRFIKQDDKIIVITDEYFTYRQERYALEETGRIYERVGNYELAISHYKKIIDEKEYNFYKFYQRICLCLEKIKDYKRELKAVKLYYTNPPIETNEYSDEWFEKRLAKINKKLNTNYTADDWV